MFAEKTREKIEKIQEDYKEYCDQKISSIVLPLVAKVNEM
jgi:hypothetical protein